MQSHFPDCCWLYYVLPPTTLCHWIENWVIFTIFWSNLSKKLWNWNTSSFFRCWMVFMTIFYLNNPSKKSLNCTVKVLFCCLTNFSCIIHSLWSRNETFKVIFVHCIPRKSHRYGFPPTFPQNGYCYIWSEKRLTFPVHLLMHISCVK